MTLTSGWDDSQLAQTTPVVDYLIKIGRRQAMIGNDRQMNPAERDSYLNSNLSISNNGKR